ncbi:MAG TPA: 3-hydroxyacyl-ACP dehydratase FabZ [Armatimonadota bacterium]|nr:3-hydroxyacyl-ACP dehydratase FabZ [Armatimonadota bacterium]
MQLDVNQVLEVLPHRYPFLLVDRILELEPGVRAVGVKNVTINEEFFNGHFPGRPLMPGVLVLEAMAQVGGILLIASGDNHGKLAVLGGIDRVRFRKPVLPGDQLVSEVVVLKIHAEWGKVRAIARVDGDIVAEAEFLCMLLKDEQESAPAAAPGVGG